MKLKHYAILFALLLAGCQAYNSLIGHPLHVLFQTHKNQESVEKYDKQSTTTKTNQP